MLTVVMALCIFPMAGTGAAYAASDSSTLEKMAKQLQDEDSDPFMFKDKASKNAVLRAAENYPDSFDLRDVDGECYVTPVKFQNPFGTCWGFAAIAAAETSLLGSGIAQHDGYGAVADEEEGIKELNLSEKHLVNFTARPIEEQGHPQYGEGLHYVNEKMSLEEKFNFGGFPFYATTLFASGVGPNLEDRTDPDTHESLLDMLSYKGANGEVEKRKINGEWTDFCYSSDDDWSIPDAYRFKQSYVLKQSYMLPSPAQFEGDNYKYDPAGTAAIKEQLMNKRAVEIAFCADTSMPNQETEGKYISKNWAHYTYEQDYASHAVTIVGWDDHYSKANFVEGHEPPEDGAWLVKNSWGAGTEEFPNYGYGNWGIPNEEGQGTGYFWLSYYDQTLVMPEALEFLESNVDTSYYLDQHDLMPLTGVFDADLEQEACTSNVFKAEVCETLRQISCQTSGPGTTVHYDIYLLQPNYEDPQDGVLVQSGEQAFDYGGFHKIELGSPEIIQRGQYYSIVLTQITSKGLYNVSIPEGLGEQEAKMADSDTWEIGVINPGESYMKVDGQWTDYSDKKFREKLFGNFIASSALDNFPIKGYSKEKDNLYISLPYGNNISLDVSGNETTVIAARLKGSKDAVVPAGTEISWALAPGSENVISLLPNTDDSSKAIVTALQPGVGYIVASAEGVGKQVIRVDVKLPCVPEIKSLKAGKKKLTVKWRIPDEDVSDGFEIQYRIKGKSAWKTKSISALKTKIVLKKLKKGKRYQVRMRSCLSAEGQKFWGEWSAVKTSKKIK